jgi:hypothetical protein
MPTPYPINPPFNFNAANVSRFLPEVTGRIMLKSMCERLGWPALAGKHLLDLGCGVRFAQTIINLEIEIGLYVGVEMNRESTEWLQQNIADPRLRFHHFDMRHPLYNPKGSLFDADALSELVPDRFDAACMFSVITHQAPDEARMIFSMLRRCSIERLYFTAFIDDAVDGYIEKDENTPRTLSYYATDTMKTLVTREGWRVEAAYPPSPSLFQQAVFVCHAA